MNLQDNNCQFQLPISYLDKKKVFVMPSNIQSDLELKELKEDQKRSIYDSVFSPKNIFARQMISSWGELYTTDKLFLTQSQKFIKHLSITTRVDNTEIEDIYTTWKELINDIHFKDTYNYMDWSMLDHLNHSSSFLQTLSILSFASPLISLTFPICFVFILPFCMLKFRNVEITFVEYFALVKNLLSSIPIGKIFHMSSLTASQKMYAVISCILYIFQTYHNAMTCIKINRNFSKIHACLEKFRAYNDMTIHTMNEVLQCTEKYSSYQTFHNALHEKKDLLERLQSELKILTPYTFSCAKILDIGHVMKYFYEIFTKDTAIHNAYHYSFGFNGYVDNLLELQHNIKSKKMNKCKYMKNKNKCIFRDSYYGPLQSDKNVVSNTYSLDNNIIITGPNAAGKTTILKGTLFNIILSQQIGYGFYKSASINPYEYLHCYINIPDTSGRDSLFQAEARQCKGILDIISANKNKRHFCVFDELYSGTNPYEAIASAYAYLEFISKNVHVDFMLTTHYIELCQRIEENHVKRIQNKYMETTGVQKPGAFEYTYKLKKGISNVKGGVIVLENLEFPCEIITQTKKLLS